MSAEEGKNMQEEDYDADFEDENSNAMYLGRLLTREERTQRHRIARSRYITQARSIAVATLKRLERVRATQGGQPSISAGRAGSVSSGLFDINRATKVQSQEQAQEISRIVEEKALILGDLIRATTIAMPTESEVHPITSSSSESELTPNSSDPSDIEDEQINTMDDGDDDKKKVESFFNNLYGMDELSSEATTEEKETPSVAARVSTNLDVDVFNLEQSAEARGKRAVQWDKKDALSGTRRATRKGNCEADNCVVDAEGKGEWMQMLR